MKRIALLTLALLAAAAGLLQADTVYNANLVNETGLTYNNTYQLDTNTVPTPAGISRIAAVASYSSATFNNGTFTDGTQSTGSFTVSTTVGLSTAAATDSITLPSTANMAAVKATDSITVVSTNGLTGAYITVNGVRLYNGTHWTSSSFSSATANSIAAAINTNFTVMVATNNLSDSVVYASASVAGLAGNRFTFAVSTPALSVGSAAFTGGTEGSLNNAFITVNGIKLRSGYEWQNTGISSETATNIAAAINSYIPAVTSTASSSVIYTTATTPGSAGNSFTLTASTPALVIASANFTGGQNNAYVSINGTRLTQGTDWTTGTTSSATAKAISDAIMANTTLSAIVQSTWSMVATSSYGVVSATSTSVGTASNFALISSTPAAITASGAAMTGGTNSGYGLATDKITVTSHGWTRALPVLYSTGTVAIGGLTNQTTYYVIPVDANTIQLASSSANAQAGTYVDLTSSSTGTTAHTYTLAPLAVSGTPSFKWQVSNDATYWTDLTTTSSGVSVSSVTVGSYTYGGASTSWDFGPLNYRYIRLNVVAPTAGGLFLKVPVNGKN